MALRSVSPLTAVVSLAAVLLAVPAAAQDEAPGFPTTEFAPGRTSASIAEGAITATVKMEKRPSVGPDPLPVLHVRVDGKDVIEAVGVASGTDEPLAAASIAEIDPGNGRKEVYFSSYSGGAHCCSTVIVAGETPSGWVATTVGEFDGDGDYLEDADGNGTAEIVTVDNAFLYYFDCYACSAAPLVVLSIEGGKVVDRSTDARFRAVHERWLAELEENTEPAERWTSPGFIAGWIATRIRLGQGADAWAQFTANWKPQSDEPVETCVTGEPIEKCRKKDRKMLKFPERLKLFLDQNGYAF